MDGLGIKVLVIRDSVKRVVTIPKRNLQSLRAGITKEFDIPNNELFEIEFYDPEWEDWVLLCGGDELPVVDKMRVRLAACTSGRHSVASASTLPVEMLESLPVGGTMTFETSSTVSADGDLRDGTDVAATDKPACSRSLVHPVSDILPADTISEAKDIRPTIEVRPVEVQETPEDCWFNPTCLSRRLQCKLEQKESLGTKDWSEITDLLYAEYTRTTESDMVKLQHRRKMSSAILTRFTHLRGSLDLRDALDWIGQMILDKFKNNKRRKAIRTAPARSSGKRQREEIQAGEPAKKRRVGGLPGYQPEYDGDEMRTRPIINKMKMDGATPELMDSTFAARRHAVMNNASVARLKRDYPGLFFEEEFWREMNRLSDRDNWLGSARRLLSAMKEKVKRLLKSSEEDAWRDLENALGSAGQVFGEVIEPGHPHIQVKDSAYILVAESQEIITVHDEDTALLAYIAMHNIFNLKYGRGARSMAVLVQKCLHIDDGQKLSAKAIRFMRSAADDA